MLLILLTIFFPLIYILYHQLFLNEEIIVILSIVLLLLSLALSQKSGMERQNAVSDLLYGHSWMNIFQSNRSLRIIDSNLNLSSTLHTIGETISNVIECEVVDESESVIDFENNYPNTIYSEPVDEYQILIDLINSDTDTIQCAANSFDSDTDTIQCAANSFDSVDQSVVDEQQAEWDAFMDAYYATHGLGINGLGINGAANPTIVEQTDDNNE